MQIILSVILSSLLIFIIYILRIVFSNILTASIRCKLWLTVFLVLLGGFLPFDRIQFFIPETTTTANTISAVSRSLTSLSTNTSIFDAAINVHRFPLRNICFHLWLLGIFISLLFCCLKYRQIYKIYRQSHIANQNLYGILRQQETIFPNKHTVKLYESSKISSAMTFGIIHPKILIPSDFSSIMTDQELAYILSHELTHIQHKDPLMNFFLIFFHCFYWFHPLFPFFQKQFRLDQEISCDFGVLSHYSDPRQAALYGQTLLHAAEYVKKYTISASSFFVDSKKQLKMRILKICSPQNGNQNLSRIFLFLLLCFSFTSVPVFSLYGSGSDIYYLSSSEKRNIQDLKISNKFHGSMVIYRESTGQYLVYNKHQAQVRVSPNSTYKIYSAIHALEENIITSQHSSMKWNHVNYPIPQWNQDQDLASAMPQSVNWYFQTLDQISGQKEMKHFYQQIQYGNQDLSSGISEYWLEASLKISPWEQVRLLKDFHENKYQWKSSTIDTVKKALFIQEKNGVSLYGKTGTGMVNGNYIHGWFIGFLEHGNETNYFALCLTSGKKVSGTKAMKTVLEILKEQKMFS